MVTWKKKQELVNTEATIEVEKKHKGKPGMKKDKKIKLPDALMEVPYCNVGASFKYTKNLGNYESATVQISLHRPCQEKDVDATFLEIKTWVDTKLGEVIAELGVLKEG